MKVALVHYWLVSVRGGEKVLQELCALFPQADIYTLVMDREAMPQDILRHQVTTSFLQRMGGPRHYQKMLPLMPFALESFDLTDYDLVISSESGPAKAIVTRPDSLHICYCHSPMRYIWDLEPEYRRTAGFLARAALATTGPLLRQWDVTTAARVDHFVANSNYVAKRIKKFYRRECTVINPPVSLERFSPVSVVDDVYICAGQVTPYKKIDLAIEAFTQMGRRLDIIGAGVSDQMRSTAGPTIRFLGTLDDAAMAERFATGKALIFPGVEDFGIVPLEVMASGRPVIAFGRGGALETVKDGHTGILFNDQSVKGIISAVERFEAEGVDASPDDFLAHVQSYSRAAFRERFRAFTDACLAQADPAG